MLSLILTFLVHTAFSDTYLQSLPGSNNRLDEANRDRNNANRCFDSQNNDRGGYNVGKLTFYAGETVVISWTNQHSAGKYQMGHTEFVIQAMCDMQVRDGTSTRTPPDAPSQCLNFDCDNDVRYCRHESYEWYQMCKATKRNMGLFTANQNMRNRNAAKNTRQNPGGTRRGYECPEERDYYPYWRQSPWFDIAYINADNERCAAVQAASDNVIAKGRCTYHPDYYRNTLYRRGNSPELPNNQAECDGSTLSFQDAAGNTLRRFSWVTDASYNISAPDCPGAVPTSRANHHGLIQNSNKMQEYQWTVPDPANPKTAENDANFFAARMSNPSDVNNPDKQCVLRIRYNMTSADYPAWAGANSIGAGLDYGNNTQRNSPNADQDPANYAIWEKYGLAYNDVWCNWDRNPNSNQQKYCRGYIYRNNPRVDPWGLNLGGDNTNTTSVQLQLAINTNQFGRTFQDRTHTFLLMNKPSSGFQGAAIDLEEPIYSVMCRGKRGNIVQVYPATEYFFHPEGENIDGERYPEGATIHFQCSGSNTNPNNNDGQGKQGTDRSNFCVMANEVYSKAYADPANYRAGCAQPGMACNGNPGRNYPARMTNAPYSSLGWTGPMENPYANIRNVFDAAKTGMSYEAWRELCMERQWLNPNQDEGNMEELDDAAADWNLGVVKMGAALEANGGAEEVTTSVISTRNNNFSNRSQKSALKVSQRSSLTNAMVSQSGGEFEAATGLGGVVVVPPGAASSAMPISLSTNEKKCEMTVDFDATLLSANGWIQLLIPCEPQALHDANVMRANGASWDTASTQPKKGFRNGKYMTVVSITSPGTYRVVYVQSGAAIAAVAIGCFCFCCAFSVAVAKRMTSS